MKPTFFNLIVIFIAASLALRAGAAAAADVESRDAWTERFPVSTAAPTLTIRNIWGDVRVLAGPEGEITLAAREHRSAPDQERYDRSLEFYSLNILSDENGVTVQVGDHGQSWRGRNPCRRCRVEFQFEVRVPTGTRVYASTVNDGRVEVTGIAGAVSADNVNGPVEIQHAVACESVESVNGDVSLSFVSAPSSACTIETINGDIRLVVPGGSGMDFSLDLHNGRITSELPVDPLAMPARVEHVEVGERHTYRIDQTAGLRLAGGGPLFSVKSLNGDFRIQEFQEPR